MKRLQFHAMGSRMLAILDSSSPAAGSVLQNVPGWFEQWEQALSRFRLDSELSLLNRSEGQPVSVSDTLWDVFHAARQAEQDTDGLVRPTVLDALLRAGYDRSFDMLPLRGETAPVGLMTFSPLTTEITWDESTHTLCLPEGTHLDLAGVAKGWAAEKAAGHLKHYGPALVDAGGDIAISAPRPGGQPWPVGIRDPFQPENHFETLHIKYGGVATSGIDYHRWQMGEKWNHHIIDPRSGLPADTDLLTVTVVAQDAIRAEAAAKAVLILGSAAGMDWLESDPALAGILVLQSGETHYSDRIRNYLWREK